MRCHSIVAAGFAIAACSTSYVPTSRGRVSVVMDTGTPAYVRDGQHYPHGFLGSGLIRAVSGNPAAEEAARNYRTRLGTGLVVSLVGTVCSTAAIFVAVERGNNHEGVAPLYAVLGCSLLIMGGAFYAISAEPYRWDAINIFNDAAPLPPLNGPPGTPVGQTARTETLRMRD